MRIRRAVSVTEEIVGLLTAQSRPGASERDPRVPRLPSIEYGASPSRGDGDSTLGRKSRWRMTQPVPRDVLLKVRKLALLPGEVRKNPWAISVTRLTTLKSLCRDTEVAHRFVTYLGEKTLQRVQQEKHRISIPMRSAFTRN
jgi:hypothetical protein